MICLRCDFCTILVLVPIFHCKCIFVCFKHCSRIIESERPNIPRSDHRVDNWAVFLLFSVNKTAIY